MITALCVIGTRPEAIKMIPVIYALRSAPGIHCRILATAQHREMLDQVLNLFDIRSDIDLNIMKPNQSLNSLAARMLTALDTIFEQERPQVVLAQGDTTTVLAAALSAFHHHIPFGHVEAGLRTGNPVSPFPEEMNRMLASKIAKWHFAPTENARRNLLAEGIPDHQIHLTGNTIVDMVRLVSETNTLTTPVIDAGKRLILVTAHRRENFGEPIREIFRAVRFIADSHDDIQIIYPVHPNPNIETIAQEMLQNHDRISLCKPLDYISFLNLMKQACLIMSDSGGIQEEALALGKPVLLFREQTERPEGVDLGGVIMVGHDYEAIVQNAIRILCENVKRRAENISPYGDGFAANKIQEILTRDLSQA